MKDYDLEKLCQLEKPYMIESGLMTEEEIDNNFEWFKILVETVRDGLDKLEDLPKAVQFLFGDLSVKEESALEELKKDNVLQLIDQFIEELNSVEEVDDEFSRTVMKKIQKATGIKGKNLYMPVRAAISGNVHGPELNNIILLLGKEKLLKRLNASKKYLK